MLDISSSLENVISILSELSKEVLQCHSLPDIGSHLIKQ